MRKNILIILVILLIILIGAFAYWLGQKSANNQSKVNSTSQPVNQENQITSPDNSVETQPTLLDESEGTGEPVVSEEPKSPDPQVDTPVVTDEIKSPDPQVAVCQTSADCQTGYFCEVTKGQCGNSGTCVDKPEACPLIYSPVCGCDGETYGNACQASAAGVSVQYDGQCQNTCQSSNDCETGEYCEKAPGQCDQTGECKTKPQACILIYSPVCGCDDKTYGNACQATLAGVSVSANGACQ